MKLSEIVLLELTGVKKYYEKTLYDMLIEIASSLGGELKRGSFGYAIVNSDWDYVYKVWYKDPPYEKYVDWMQSHQDSPHVPKIKRKLLRLDAFNLRPDEETFDKINVLKIEKLRGPKNKKEEDLLEQVYGASAKFTHAVVRALDKDDLDVKIRIPDYLYGMVYGKDALKKILDAREEAYVTLDDFFKHLPEALDFFIIAADFYRTVKGGSNKLDMHDANIMIRDSDGAFVIADPIYDDDLHTKFYSGRFRDFPNVKGKRGTEDSSVFKSTSDLEKASNSLKI